MEYDGQAAMQLLNGAKGAQAMRNNNSSARNTPFTIDEALPFSPFSSIVPFDSGIIPLPTIGTRTSSSIYSTTAERDAARQDLEALNSQAAFGTSVTSQSLQRTLRDLHELLKPEEITQFRFDSRFERDPASSQQQNQPPTVSPKLNLSPFAKMVYNTTDPPYIVNYPVTKPGRSINKKGKQSPHISNPSPLATNSQAFNRNSNIQVNVPVANPNASAAASTSSQVSHIPKSTPQPRQNGSSTSQARIEVKIPVAPKPSSQSYKPSPVEIRPSVESNIQISIPANVSNPEAYVAVPEPIEVKSAAGRKRKRSSTAEDLPLAAASVDQRQKADTAVRNLKDYMQDIFEAEDQIRPDSSTLSALFTTVQDGENEPTLAAATHSKLELLVQKTISNGRYADVPIDDLVRIQKLSESAIKAAEAVNLKFDEGWDSSDLEAWLQNISTAELGLKSSFTSLRLMTGGREDKQIYSEEIIQSSLNVLKNFFDSCIVPVVESRSTGSTANIFKLLSSEKKTITMVLTRCRRLLSLISDLVRSIELSESVINGLEFAATQLIFVENAHAEKDSVLGIQRFDHLRVVAMEVLSQIFLKHPAQRQGIFDEILTSLEKLPVTKQSARQFKLPDGGSIQLVSALIMRLVQTSANKVDEGLSKRKGMLMEAMNGDGEEEDEDSMSEVAKAVPKRNTGSNDTEKLAMEHSAKAVAELRTISTPLIDTASRNAHYVVNFIVTRAMGATKTGDTPYRNLLDLFVEDFIACLRLSDWPGAALLLRLLLLRMVKISEDAKSTAPAKNMALDLLGVMASAISELNSQIRKASDAMANSESDTGSYWVQLAEIALEGKSNVDDLLVWSGPYHASLQFLNERCSGDPQLRSAVGFFAANWASQLCTGYDQLRKNDDEDQDQKMEEYGKASYRLRMIIGDQNWLSAEGTDSIEAPHGRLAYSITLLNSPFCNYFQHALRILLQGMGSDQATVRSKSLKSVTQVLETDPTILDRMHIVKNQIVYCANEDPSVQVRDSALGLLGRCISLRPALENDMIPVILKRVNDSSIGVRKRAMKLSKDIYLRNKDKEIRSSIADALIHRVIDTDEGVQELARQTIEEIWMSPFYRPTSSDDTDLPAQYKLYMTDHVDLMVRTVQRRSGVASVLDKILQSMLSNDSKNAVANFRVCKILVAAMFDTFIDNPNRENSAAPDAKESLVILQIFAKANAKLFTVDQIQLLQPFISNLAINDDLTIYQSIVVIFRHVLPQLSAAHGGLLQSIRTILMKAVSRHKKSILDDIVACLWIISIILKNSEGLMRLAVSSIKGVQGSKGVDFKDPANANASAKLQKYMLIGGMVGKHCDLDSHIGGEFLTKSFPSFRGTSLSKLMVDTYAPFSSPSQPMDVRRSALDSMCSVSQSWPKCFSQVNVYTAFQQAFDEQASDLIYTVMSGFKAFLVLEERRSEAGAEPIAGAAQESVATLGVMGGSQQDGVAIAIAQRFLEHITRIALGSQCESALLATEILGSINRQGLVHPKECGTAFVALETSQNSKISDIAFREHRTAHVKHETILEKEYMRAVQTAFIYQRDVVKDPHGASGQPLTSKLHLLVEVFKISKPKSRKRFFETMCARVDFDPVKLDTTTDMPPHLEFARFLVENLAFFDYVTVDELLATLSAMEKVVSGTGTGIAHAIESDVFQIRMGQSSQINSEGQEVTVEVDQPVDSARLRHLTTCSMILSALWETRTFIRKFYDLNSNSNKSKESKAKAMAKDLNKQPIRVQGITGDKYWDEINMIMSSLSSEATMMEQCRSFVDLLTVDKDFKIAAEEGDDLATMNNKLSTPSDDDDEDEPREPKSGGSGRSRKRKSDELGGSKSGRGRPTKRRARSSSRGPSGKKSRKGSAEDAEGDDDWA